MESHARIDTGAARRRAAPLWAVIAIAAILPAVALGNPITDENGLTGSPASVWDVSGAGDPSIQGFATDISVNKGGTVRFKIRSGASAYHIDIYRLGYYQGNGARNVGAGVVTATLPQTQPADLQDPVTGLTDCGNWAESAHWDVPAGAVSGIYIAKLTRDDTQGASHIVFIVRDDASHSDLLFQTSDATWQAYNGYGGNSLYVGGATGPPALNHASKVSYNRPFTTRGGGGGGGSEDWVFNSEYPMVRWLESNGYDVTYTTNVDTDRRGNLILQHRAFLSVGHDEYWSAGARANVQAARDAGVHLAFFSGNEIYWKTRYEQSTDGSSTPYRTLVCYKEGTLGENQCGTKCDPLPNVWTGLWRDGCAPTYAPNDACLPENALSGQISWDGSTGAITVSDAYKNLRFWRNTSVATLGAGQTATLGSSTLGYEWDWQQYDGFYPARRILLSTTSFNGRTHHLSLYRHDSGALVFGAGTVQWSWGLDGSHDRGSDAPVTAMQQATVNLFADMGVAPGSLQPGLVPATASSDTQAPASVIGFPLDGGSVPSGNSVNIQGTASDAGGGVVAGVEVSVDGGATWHAAAGTTTWSYAWTPGAQGPVTIKSRAFDDTGNLEVPAGPANVITVTVTAPVPPSCPCTVFQPTDTPGGQFNDGQAINAGMKFRTTVDGFITGARFYKGPANTGTHTGLLWSSTGTLLAQAVFTGETASGWQEVTFTSPVAVTAGTTYLVAYHSSGGGYAANDTYFTSAVVNGPLRGLASGEDGPNGMYVYAATPTFPTQNFQTSNYWVDVVFNTTVGPDETPPTVTALSPTNGATAVAVGASVSATFSEAIDAATVSGSTFELRDPSSALVAATVSYSVATRTATLAPGSALAYSTTYTATVKGGGTDPRIKDPAGNALAANQVWSFTTSSPPPPPPTEGPGGPILVISAASNPFSRYFVEILRAEGLNEFFAMDISQVTPTVLNNYDVVILGEMTLTVPQVTMLTDWTTAGGTLVAMRPDAQLAGLLGITPDAGTLADKYLLVNTATGPGVGIVNQTIQFHGTADLYTLSGATAVATLYSDATTATTNPAVTQRNVGANGGKACAFTYDLARSVVYTRQGNPAWAGQKRDGQINPIRSDDQFFPDWIDFNKVAIPQADEQQRLLANAITLGNLHRKPLPRLWYLPKGLKAAIVETGDNHGDGGMQPRFDIYRNESPANCSVADWECVRGTGYLYVGSTFTDAQAVFYQSLGFEVALHVDTGCANFTETQYQSQITNQFAAFHARYPSIPLPVTNRNHCIAWSGWSTTPEVEAANGIRFDTNYYYWPSSWIQNRPGMFTGSGLPMRFAKLDGTIIDCFQASTEMPDESGESFPAFSDALLNKATGPEGYYGVFTTNMHFDTANHAGSNAIVASAQAHGVPVVSAKQMLEWLDGRNGSSFGAMSWSGNALSFTIAAAAGSRNMQAMVPTNSAVGPLSEIRLNGSPVTYTTQTIKGIQYAFFPANAGNYVADYSPDMTPPVIGSVAAVPYDDGTATIAWTTNEASDSRVDYGSAQGSLTLNASNAALVTSHSVTLTGLAASTLHYYRVTSADAASNSATEPIVANDPLSFTTPASVCFRDQVTSDFAGGTTGAGTSVVTIVDGEVTLRAAAAAEFTVLPPTSEWQSFAWTAGGVSTVAAGLLTVDGARFNTEPTTTTYGPGTSVEYVATFNANRHQYVGFGGGDDGIAGGSIFNSAPWAMFGTGTAGTSVLARVNLAGTLLDFTVPGSLLGTAHKYRVDWKTTSVDFYVDDALVHTEAATVAGPMRVAISDYDAGGLAVTVDWIHATPYAASGSFTSRVYDGGASTTWDQMSWTASVPSGTSLQMFERQGNTPSPDGSWTTYAPVPSSGTTIGGSARYIQYLADLATTIPSATPVVQDVHISCNAGPDATPPVISGVTATPGGGGATAAIGWNTDELATSSVDYGTSQGSLLFHVSSASLVGVHAMMLTGLSPNTAYYYRVTSVDAASNSATEPILANPPLSFTTSSPPCVVDGTVADFAGGTTGSGTYISDTAGGEVILQPAAGAEFTGSALPAGWQSGTWSGGGTATVGGGVVAVDGAHVSTVAGFGPGRSVEFIATFQAANYQNVGFAADGVFNSPWVTIGLGATTGGVYARRDDGADVLLSATALGSPHRYRIDWNATDFVFYVDGIQVATMTRTVGTDMVALLSDFSVGGPALGVDWLRLTPYSASGAYASRVFDSGGVTTWGAASWTSILPPGTSLAMSARRGGTPVPDGSWTSFAIIPSPGSSIAGTGRYLQYRADLATTDGAVTSELRDVTIECVTSADATPPVVTSVVATPASDGLSASVTWTTDEPADSRVDYGTSPGSLTLNVSGASLVTSHGLTLSGLSPGLTYYYRVSSADASANGASSPVPPATANFFTPVPCPSDQIASDFGLGALDANTAVSLIGDGEVILKPASGAEFTGSALPGDWQSGTWAGGGTATVSGGQLAVDGAHAATTATFGPGRSIEFVATFQAATNQHIGFTADFAFNSPWAIFSTFGSTTGLYARVNSPGGSTDNLIPSSLLGSPHRYRIDWNSTSFAFYVDGSLVSTITRTVSSSMLAHVSDLAVAGPSLSVDWLRVTPYAASGSFTSRILDQGGPTNWAVATWTSSTPTGTSLAVLARTGNTATPDGTWSAFAALTNGVAVGGNSRYLQYRADLSTSVPGWTPEFQGIAIACVSGPDMTPPVITNVAATPALDGLSATVTWTTDEVATSRVDYGTSSGSLTLNASNASPVKSHSLALTGLSPLVTYYYRVTSVDGSSNSTTSPIAPSTLSFTTPAPACFVDQTEANFLAGATGINTYVSNTTDGEVISAPTLGSEFTATSLPSGWTSVLWSNGAAGGSTYPGGSVSVDGGRLTPTSLTGFSAGHVLEFVATFANAGFQHVGFGNGDNTTGGSGMFNNSPASWAMFSTGGGGSLKARLNIADAQSDLDLGASYLGVSHVYRIEWKSSPDSVIWLVDGASVRRVAATIAATMRPGASDFTAGGAVLSINWLRMSPYVSPGSFTSRVYDGGVATSWGVMTWTSTLPAGTSLGLEVRKGDTPTPDGTWTTFASVPSSGSTVGGVSRYIQYRADLATTDPGQTAALNDVSITCTPCNAGPPSAIADLSASGTGNAGGGRADVRLNWSGVAPGQTVAMYRKAYGDYPLYRGTHGGVPSVPATPAAALTGGWTLTNVTTSAGLDAPPTRGFWYYVAFVTNECGAVSGPSVLTAGTLDYLLGDVSDGLALCAGGGEAGNTVVNTSDMSALGANYGQSFGPADDRICLDVGPTVDYGLRSRPMPDGVLNFEDLVLYALNYEVPLPAAPAARPAAAHAVASGDEVTVAAPAAVRAGETFEVTLHLRGSGAIWALSSSIAWDASVAEIADLAPGALLTAAGGVALSPRPGTVDVAVLGSAGPGLAGEGDLAVVTFRALRDGDPAVRLARTVARGAGNQTLALGAVSAPAAIPYTTRIGPVFPNPFQGSLNVSFSLARDARVKLVVFDLAGRAVRHLEDGGRPAGTHIVTWDGRGDGGVGLSPGSYIVRFESGEIRENRRVQLIR